MRLHNLFLGILLISMMISLVSADLGTFQQNDCVPIVTALNATTITLTNINSPAPNSTVLLTNQAMTKSGNFFNYSFCNTSLLGTYSYAYCDQDSNCYANTFDVNGSGQIVTQHQITLIIIGLVIFIILAIFFFVLAILFKHPGTKMFLMFLSGLTLITLIGVVTSNASIYLAEFPNIVSIYNSYYIIMVTLAGIAIGGVVVWLIYYSLMLFNKSRGRIPDD